MINKHFFEIVLLLLASSTLFSPELKLALFQQRVNRELKLLNKFPKSSVQPCLPHRTNFLLSQQSVNRRRSQSGQALAILHEMLLQTFSLFRAGISLDGWEEIRVEFLTELHQQLEYLGALRGLGAEQNSGVLSGGNSRMQVKKYFRRIHNYLENQEYNSCAWREINRCLFFAFQLVRKLSK
uniref:Interferon epsilon n=1 Tax=Mustela putorius furo TaxID=9669 RepID=M3YX13_MUSPF